MISFIFHFAFYTFYLRNGGIHWNLLTREFAEIKTWYCCCCRCWVAPQNKCGINALHHTSSNVLAVCLRMPHSIASIKIYAFNSNNNEKRKREKERRAEQEQSCHNFSNYTLTLRLHHSQSVDWVCNFILIFFCCCCLPPHTNIISFFA